VFATVANSAWFASCIPEYLRFRCGLSRVREEQEQVLFEILRKNRESEFGRRHEFAMIRTARDYQQRIPLRDYEDYRQLVNRIAEGDSQVLTEEPVCLFEPTSGSVGTTKWIPYTSSLQNEFQRGIRAWVADLFLNTPDLLHGPAYWSVSPSEDCEQITRSGIRVGFADDSEYVGGVQRRLVQAVMAVPAHVRKLRDLDAFWYTTLLHLVRRPDLRFISVWSPSFLTLLMDRLPEFGDRLVREAPEIKRALCAGTAAERHVLLWPRLRMISCWTESNSALAASKLAALFPQTRICGKGLIATEGFVSFPWEARGASVLAIRSHFLEFLPVDSNDNSDTEHPQLAHELEPGQRYSVVLTTGGGFYRYLLGDLIEVVGREQQCPLVRFLGRGRVVDWCGEKLHEAQVLRVLTEAFSTLHVAPSFAMLACDTTDVIPAYVLYLEAAGSEDRLVEIAAAVESGLRESFHYNYARRLGQLGQLRIFAAQNAEASYVSACIARGQRAGNVKPVSLDHRAGWTARFHGRFVETTAAVGSAP
jgi:GH3 auxin-responsive promoter